MARLTITDCLRHVKDKYELIVLAASRSRQLYAGATPKIKSDDRIPVVALREIAAGLIDTKSLEDKLIQSFRKTKDPIVATALTEEEKSDELRQIESELA